MGGGALALLPGNVALCPRSSGTERAAGRRWMREHGGVFGEESFGVGRSRAHPRPHLLTSPSQTRGEETQVPSQLLRLPKREVHPHDLDL